MASFPALPDAHKPQDCYGNDRGEIYPSAYVDSSGLLHLRPFPVQNAVTPVPRLPYITQPSLLVPVVGTTRRTKKKPHSDADPPKASTGPQLTLTDIRRDRQVGRVFSWAPPKPEEDYTFPQDDSQRFEYVLQLLNGMIDVSKALDTPSEKTHFGKNWQIPARDGRLHFDIYHMARVCWDLLQIAENLHQHGLGSIPCYDEQQFEQAKTYGYMTFRNRMDTLTDLLYLSKHRCESLLVGQSEEMVVLLCKTKRDACIDNAVNNADRARAYEVGSKAWKVEKQEKKQKEKEKKENEKEAAKQSTKKVRKTADKKAATEKQRMDRPGSSRSRRTPTTTKAGKYDSTTATGGLKSSTNPTRSQVDPVLEAQDDSPARSIDGPSSQLPVYIGSGHEPFESRHQSGSHQPYRWSISEQPYPEVMDTWSQEPNYHGILDDVQDYTYASNASTYPDTMSASATYDLESRNMPKFDQNVLPSTYTEHLMTPIFDSGGNFRLNPQSFSPAEIDGVFDSVEDFNDATQWTDVDMLNSSQQSARPHAEQDMDYAPFPSLKETSNNTSNARYPPKASGKRNREQDDVNETLAKRSRYEQRAATSNDNALFDFIPHGEDFVVSAPEVQGAAMTQSMSTAQATSPNTPSPTL
ncbi:hypothetical protein EKO04_011445 [Ascochyta lentis]|uniref:Uncharacterized protein n=1 Tax=Ascochyta lentis TaxID=205686 RepID=A0A8H7ISM9_9PLEO|nr:hypothetical protein EKO04_011445 [Ascochyta lentis]